MRSLLRVSQSEGHTQRIPRFVLACVFFCGIFPVDKAIHVNCCCDVDFFLVRIGFTDFIICVLFSKYNIKTLCSVTLLFVLVHIFLISALKEMSYVFEDAVERGYFSA